MLGIMGKIMYRLPSFSEWCIGTTIQKSRSGFSMYLHLQEESN